MTKQRTATITPYCRSAPRQGGSGTTWVLVHCPGTLTEPGRLVLMGRKDGVRSRACHVIRVLPRRG